MRKKRWVPPEALGAEYDHNSSRRSGKAAPAWEARSGLNRGGTGSGSAGPKAEAVPEDDWDDVVEQTFPASDSPPPPSPQR